MSSATNCVLVKYIIFIIQRGQNNNVKFCEKLSGCVIQSIFADADPIMDVRGLSGQHVLRGGLHYSLVSAAMDTLVLCETLFMAG